MKKSREFNLISIVSTLMLISGCGSSKQSSDDAPGGTVIERFVAKVAADSGVPARLMLAAGFLESGIRVEPSTALYVTNGKSVTKGPARGESVFGFSFFDLGLTAASQPPIEDQITAYGKMVKSKITKEQMPKNALTSEEKIRWIWKLAEIHRGDASKRNLLAVFSKEMISIINEGFSVQNAEGLVAHLDKEPKAIKDEDIPDHYRQDITLDLYHADIRSAYLFSLKREASTDVVNHPKRVEVIHCPFALSVCIQLQTNSSSTTTPLAAHYLIPSSDAVVPGVIQFAHHDEAVQILDSNGDVEIVKDRIVIMLVGRSGRYKDGQRNYADPQWVTDSQLRFLGAAVSEICASISKSEGVDREKCQTFGAAGGPMFRSQNSDTYQWGDIPDFDEAIFLPYLSSLEGIAANTTLSLANETVQTAGVPFNMTASFHASARRLELERLVRCPAPDSRVIWEPVAVKPVRNKSTYVFADNDWDDAGPNGTGEQFFRVKAIGDRGKFLGWFTKRVLIKGYDKTQANELPSKYCIRNGT